VNGFIDAMALNQRMTRMENPELQDLVDAPRERLDTEYKAWLDLDDKAMQAKLAKHLWALANHGSGYVVFGIADDMTSAGEPPAQAGPYSRDSLSGIVKRYLTPAFQVEVYEVESARTGVAHPVVWVPSHEAVPVCSKRAGPHNGGKPVGIEQGTHYTREPGPASVPATTPEHWRPIIRRCVRHDRRALLDGIEPLLRTPGKPVPEPGDALQRWHEAAHRKFLQVVDGDPGADLLKRANYQLSYRIGLAGGEPLGMGGLVDELRKMGNEVRQFVNSGLPMFDIVYSSDFMPHSTFEPRLGEDEFLECNPVNADGRYLMLWDFWRVSPGGMATIVRAYQEDRLHGWSSTAGLAPGTWFLALGDGPRNRRDGPPCSRLCRTLRGAGDTVDPCGVAGATGQDARGSGKSVRLEAQRDRSRRPKGVREDRARRRTGRGLAGADGGDAVASPAAVRCEWVSIGAGRPDLVGEIYTIVARAAGADCGFSG